jgi:biopolymer transport protein ExbB/TolQ
MNFATASLSAVLGNAAVHSLHSAVILVILFCCSCVSLAYIVERWMYFRRIRTNSDEVLDKLRESLGAGRAEEALLVLGDARGNPVLEMIQAGIKSSRLSPAQIAEILRICQARHQVGLESSLGLLGTLGNVAPFIGLLGTVLGIMQAFQDLSGPQAQVGGAAIVAAGIAEALVATAAGLMVAIPAVVFYNHFLRKSKGVLTQMEVAGRELLLLFSLREQPAAEGVRHGSRQK